MSNSGESRKPTGRETRKRLVLGIGFGMVAGLAAVEFSNSVALGVLFGCLMSVPAIISSRSPVPDRPRQVATEGPSRTFLSASKGYAKAGRRLNQCSST